MLVLTRRSDESLVINNDIVITILSIDGDKVKVGISAPREIAVLRKELWDAINEQNQIAELLSTNPESSGFEDLRKFLSEETALETEKESTTA
ncbi:MAG: carbon storage regulator CsrA [Anaerolineales bacterium]|nr:carbon storage regulator CsrA [Anaerolineales bacterium]